MKKCIKCGDSKEFELFYKDKRRKDGYQNKCISCTKEENKNWSSLNKKNNYEYKEKNKKFKKYITRLSENTTS